MSLSLASAYGEPPRRGVPRWIVAAAIVVAVHAALGVVLLRRDPPSTAGETVDVVEIDLTPPDRPAPPAPDPAPAPPQEAMSEVAPPAPPVVETPAPVAAPLPDPPPTIAAPPVTAPSEAVPDTPVLSKPDVANAPPPDPAIKEARQAEANEEAVRERARVRMIELQAVQRRQAIREDQRRLALQMRREAEQQAKREAHRAAAQAQAQAQKEQARREASASARAAARDKAADMGAAGAASIGDWKGQVAARVNAAKQTFPGGGDGVATVAFTVDRSGRLSAIHVAASSGSATLDQAALATVRRVGAVPPPPGGHATSVSVRIRFSS